MTAGVTVPSAGPGTLWQEAGRGLSRLNSGLNHRSSERGLLTTRDGGAGGCVSGGGAFLQVFWKKRQQIRQWIKMSVKGSPTKVESRKALSWSKSGCTRTPRGRLCAGEERRTAASPGFQGAFVPGAGSESLRYGEGSARARAPPCTAARLPALAPTRGQLLTLRPTAGSEPGPRGSQSTRVPDTAKGGPFHFKK